MWMNLNVSLCELSRQNCTKKTRGYSCNLCEISTNDFTSMKFHMEAKHFPSCEGYTCDVCQKHCKTRHALSTHKSRYHKSSFIDPEKLFQFVVKDEGKPGPNKWSCRICWKKFDRRIAVTNHCESTHLEKMFRYICQVCNKEMPSSTYLDYHTTIYHKKVKPPVEERTQKQLENLGERQRGGRFKNITDDIEERMKGFSVEEMNVIMKELVKRKTSLQRQHGQSLTDSVSLTGIYRPWLFEKPVASDHEKLFQFALKDEGRDPETYKYAYCKKVRQEDCVEVKQEQEELRECFVSDVASQKNCVKQENVKMEDCVEVKQEQEKLGGYFESDVGAQKNWVKQENVKMEGEEPL